MHSLNETIFAEIIEKKKLKPFFQPIVSLRNGKVIAYEALSRVTGKYEDISIGDMFDMATKLDCPWRLEKLCRSLAIKQASKKPKQAKLFINVDGHVLLDSEFKQGFTQDSMRKYNLETSDIVFEITERSDVENKDLLLSLIRHYENQGFAIAIDDIGSGYSGLNRLNYLNPQYVKIDYELVHNIQKSKAQSSIVRLMVNYCREMHHVLIAEGIESKEELACLIELGVECGQGFYLAKPKETFENIPESVQKTIKYLYDDTKHKKEKHLRKIASVSKAGIVLYPECTIKHAYNLFMTDSKIQEIAVVDRESHLHGVLCRKSFIQDCEIRDASVRDTSQKLEDIITNKPRFCVAAKETLKRAARQAMSRPGEECYDAFAVVDDNRYCGMVTVRDLVRTLAEGE